MARFAALTALVLSTLLLGGGASPAEAQALAQRAAEKTVRFPGRAEEPGDTRGEFASDLLALVLAQADEGYRLEIVGGMNQPRRIQAAHEGLVDVVVLPHQASTKSRLIPIRHPLQRGLLGVRVLLARPEMAERLMTIGSLEELKRGYVMGYGANWLDRDVMARLGFRMEYGSRYTGLFEMLRAGRFDYLTRGVGELRGHHLILIAMQQVNGGALRRALRGLGESPSDGDDAAGHGCLARLRRLQRHDGALREANQRRALRR